MLGVGEFQVFNSNMMNLSLRHGNALKTISECPHHGMKNWLLMQMFYHGLTNSTHETMDAATRGAFLSLTILAATALVEKMASNQG